VVINEIMYHPPDDREDLQFIEVLNPGAASVDLSGWSFTKGVTFVFPHGTRIPPGESRVICRDIEKLKAHYGPEVQVAGVFAGRLNHTGERLELTDPHGHVVEALGYDDRAPWPLGADGYGASLERICPSAPANDPANWAASELSAPSRPGGTPGRRNSCFSPTPLPLITDVSHSSAEPQRPVTVTARVADPTGVESVTLGWAAWSGEGPRVPAELPMRLKSGDARQGLYVADIPAQPEGRVLRFTVSARTTAGCERRCPAKTEPRPTFSCATFLNTNTARIPFLKVLTVGSAQRQTRSRSLRAVAGAEGTRLSELESPWTSTAVFLPPGQKEVVLFDYVQVRPRKGGLKVHVHSDQTFDGMTGINVLFEDSPRYVLAEPLAYELYRRAGVPAPLTQHVRLWVGSRPAGYHLVVEQPNKAFLRRNHRDAGGNLYKLLWYADGLVGQHEKKTHPHSGHQDLIDFVEGLNRGFPAGQWDFIQQHANVDEFINYYAVNMCIQNWDGFFNNYLAYHDLRPGGKWEIIPWDEDKTWGDYDGAASQYDWYEMPLTFGMNGDKASRRSWFDRGPFGGVSWWRPPGYFSGPLLANPEFRRRFLSRLREICLTIFTPERMGPVINSLRSRLEEEVALRAKLHRQDPADALSQFHEHLESFRNQVANRRKFILSQIPADPGHAEDAK
jgi:hypothetical protein